jgi:hypothetical protein
LAKFVRGGLKFKTGHFDSDQHLQPAPCPFPSFTARSTWNVTAKAKRKAKREAKSESKLRAGLVKYF